MNIAIVFANADSNVQALSETRITATSMSRRRHQPQVDRLTFEHG